MNEVKIVKQFKIVVEKHPDTYVAYPLGLKGVAVGQGVTYEAALADVKSAIKFHIETFGPAKPSKNNEINSENHPYTGKNTKG